MSETSDEEHRIDDKPKTRKQHTSVCAPHLFALSNTTFIHMRRCVTAALHLVTATFRQAHTQSHISSLLEQVIFSPRKDNIKVPSN